MGMVKEMSDTPRTDVSEIDALTLDIPGQTVSDKVVRSGMARLLERELSAAAETIYKLEAKVERLNVMLIERIKEINALQKSRQTMMEYVNDDWYTYNPND